MNNIFSYIYDFLSLVFENDEIKNEIKSIVLFGSVAKGVYDKKSDIDLFFDVKHWKNKETIERNLKSVLKSFEIKAEKTWNLKGMKFPINFIVDSLESETWTNLKDEIISSGIVLFGDYKETPENVEHLFLFYYTLNNLNRKNKMKFIRKFFGYSIRKKDKEYKQKGLLEVMGGIKLSSNVILIPSRDVLNVKNVFNEYKIKYKIKEIWIRR